MDLDSISDSEWTYLQAFLEGSQATDLEKAQLHYLFSLKAESCGDSIQQFEQIKMMNYLKRQTFVFDIKKSEDEMQEIINRFDSKFFAERSHFGRGGISPIFIVGMPRSGSTIVEQSLSVHSCVRGCGELRHIADLVQALSYVKIDPVANLIDHVASMTKTQSMGFAETY